ncbi:uncharacterized protein G2W53_015824 [Senna tora]|uniref:Uncharacterized protein n=1 Tax=Senna tora TaxID=362788 RepID=A0A835C8N4_9FABA|nr:uncharacterized protein G2W53_015824 [Senna tora]
MNSVKRRCVSGSGADSCEALIRARRSGGYVRLGAARLRGAARLLSFFPAARLLSCWGRGSLIWWVCCCVCGPVLLLIFADLSLRIRRWFAARAVLCGFLAWIHDFLYRSSLLPLLFTSPIASSFLGMLGVRPWGLRCSGGRLLCDGDKEQFIADVLFQLENFSARSSKDDMLRRFSSLNHSCASSFRVEGNARHITSSVAPAYSMAALYALMCASGSVAPSYLSRGPGILSLGISMLIISSVKGCIDFLGFFFESPSSFSGFFLESPSSFSSSSSWSCFLFFVLILVVGAVFWFVSFLFAFVSERPYLLHHPFELLFHLFPCSVLFLVLLVLFLVIFSLVVCYLLLLSSSGGLVDRPVFSLLFADVVVLCASVGPVSLVVGSGCTGVVGSWYSASWRLGWAEGGTI